MEKWTFVLSVAMATAPLVFAQTNSSSMFQEIPMGNYSEPISTSATGSLRTLFDMAKGFVDVVFKPFSELEEFILTAAKDDDILGYLLDNWQEAAKFEAGYIACLVFGVLFIVLVPLVGSIMCCCRCCCNNCGGRLEQSQKRSKSCWRQCLCVTMLILTALMAIPTVFVFLTNEWITDVVDTAPNKINAALDDTVEYTKLVPRQVTSMTDQYSTVDDNVRPLVEDFGTSIGIPLQQYVSDTAQGALDQMDAAIAVVDETVAAINSVDSSLTALEVGMAGVDSSLASLQVNMTTTLNDSLCLNDVACEAVFKSRTNLAVGFDVTELSGLHSDLKGVNDSLTGFDLKGLRSDVTTEIDEIPQTTREQTQDASNDAVKALDEAESSVSDVSSSLPDFSEIDSQVEQIQTSITNGFETYDEDFDKYRYIAGVVLGSLLAFIVAWYLLGMLLGICGNDRKVSPSQRGCSSNCGGIMLMVGVGFSFIFSFLLMTLVIVLFTIGGHGERYGCQGLDEPNYEALDVVEELANLNLTDTLKLTGTTLTLADVLRSCKDNKPAYEAFKLEYAYNVTSILGDVTTQVDSLETVIDEATSGIDLTAIDIYTDQNQKDLLSLTNSGIEDVDFERYLTDLGNGITKVDLTEYANFLRTSANNFSTATSFKALVKDYADEVDRIQSEEVDSLQADYDSLKTNADTLKDQSEIMNATIVQLDEALVALNDTIQDEGKDEITKIADSVYQQVSGNITAYTTWTETQIKENVGACYPVYQSYTVSVGVFCDYLIDTVNGLWFSLGWAIFFLIPSAIIAMKLMKFFRRMTFDETYEDSWDDVEMRDFGSAGNKPNGGGYY